MDPQSAINILKKMINENFKKVEDLKLLMQLFDITLNQYYKKSKLPGYYYFVLDFLFKHVLNLIYIYIYYVPGKKRRFKRDGFKPL